jgi:hypothetical protein
MFGIGALQRTLSILTAENSDLRHALRNERENGMKERELWTKERTEFVDRIIALTKPAVHALMHPEPRPTPAPTPHIARLNQPGLGRVIALPPYPDRPADRTLFPPVKAS